MEPDRRTVTLPVVGTLRSKESTRRLERLVATGRGRILSATLSERLRRLFVSFSCLVEAHPYPAPTTGGRAGVDLGLRVLATVVDDTGTITHVPNPAPLRATLTERRRVGRQLFSTHPRLERPPGGQSQARPAGPPNRAPAPGVRPPAHHDAGGHLPRGGGRRPRPRCHEEEHGAPGLPALCVRRCARPDQATAHLQDGVERKHAHGRRPLVRLLQAPSHLWVPLDRAEEARQTTRLCTHGRAGRPGRQRSEEPP